MMISRATPVMAFNPKFRKDITLIPQTMMPRVVVTPSTEKDLIDVADWWGRCFSPFVQNLLALAELVDVPMKPKFIEHVITCRFGDPMELIMPYGAIGLLLDNYPDLSTVRRRAYVHLARIVRFPHAIKSWNGSECRFGDTNVFSHTLPDVTWPRDELATRADELFKITAQCKGFPKINITGEAVAGIAASSDVVIALGDLMLTPDEGYFLRTSANEVWSNPNGLHPHPRLSPQKAARLGGLIAFCLSILTPMPFTLSRVFMNLILERHRRATIKDPLQLVDPSTWRLFADGPQKLIGRTWDDPYLPGSTLRNGIIQTPEQAMEYREMILDIACGDTYEQNVITPLLEAMDHVIQIQQLRRWRLDDMAVILTPPSGRCTYDELCVGFTRMDGNADTWPQAQWFIEVVADFNESEQRKLFHFLAGLPAGRYVFSGVMDNVPRRKLGVLCRARWQGNQDTFYPKGIVCHNKIMLPDYSTKDVMRKKLTDLLAMPLNAVASC